MHNKKFISFVAVLLAVLLLGSLVIGVIGSTFASAVTQSQIDELEAERDEIKSRQNSISEQLSTLEDEMSSVLERKEALDEQNELTRQDIEVIEEQIELYTEMVEEKEREVELALQTEQDYYDRYKARVRAMEENDTWDYLTVLFQATSFSEFLSLWDDVTNIMAWDQSVEDEYIASREALEATQAEYEDTLALYEDKLVELEAEKAELEEQIEAASLMIADLENDIEEYTAAYEEGEAQRSSIQSRIDEMVAELEAQEAAAAAAAAATAAAAAANNTTTTTTTTTVTTSSGYYYWPCQSCTYLTSRFGYRVHPIFGTTKYHAGVDIGASAGATISAAAAGTVTIAEYSSSYGNYVVIYHSNGTTTLYAHMSSIAVSAGDTVSQGQTIGYVGSTGNSTGPHLHFEIRVNGSNVDPLSYFSGMSFSYASDY
ncbi:MAG: peptidoglycan DD-metalloendopeptidase family protein [Oscillospiraceae bacterium]|nr:peptidoglycan DD-metalloendopeptidase family protein [Oscillospiraceae bacterium]